MKITLTGSLGNITKPLATILINAGHQVTIVSSNAEKAADIEALGAKAAIGSITDVPFLTRAFTGADAVYAMVPPNINATDFRGHAGRTGKNYAEAIKQSGVTHVVYLSSIGAQYNSGTGPITGSHDVEGILNQLDNVAIRFMRPVFFMTNFFNNIPMIKNMGIIGANYPADARLIMVHPTDIAAAIAEEIQQPFIGQAIRYVAGDELTTAEVAQTLGAAIDKPELPWVAFTDEQALQGMLQSGMQQEMSSKIVEMGTAVRSGILWTDYDQHKTDTTGKIKLEAFAKEFAEAYNQ